MEKIEKLINQTFNPVILYLDDIKKIYELMESEEPELRIITDDYILDNIDELSNLKRESINVLQISKDHYNFRFEMGESDIRFVSGKDTPAISGIYLQIKEIMKKRERKLVSFFRSKAFILIFPGIGGMLFWFGILRWKSVHAIVIGLAIFLLTILISFKYTFGSYQSKIILKYKIDSPSFFRRNRDEIIIGIVFYILGELDQ